MTQSIHSQYLLRIGPLLTCVVFHQRQRPKIQVFHPLQAASLSV